MRLLAYWVVMAACSTILTTRCSAVLAADNTTTSPPEKQSDAVEKAQVLIEATIIRVESYKEPTAETISSILVRALNAQPARKQGPASVLADASNIAASGLSDQIKPLGVAFVDSGTDEFVRTIEKLAEINVLAAPRLLVLNKQRAEIQLDNSGIRVRPHVSPEGMIRLETRLECRKRNEDPIAVTTDILIPNGNTAIFSTLSDPAATKKSRSASSPEKKELLVTLRANIWKPGTPLATNRSHQGNFTKRILEVARSKYN